jgi:serine/threonine protein kinase
MVIGWFPFLKQETKELEKQILNEELDYKRVKKLKNASIKDEFKKELNSRLKKVSEECIDLIEKMLCKDPCKRIEMIDIFDHPFIQKYKMREIAESDEEFEETESSAEEEEDSFDDTESINSMHLMSKSNKKVSRRKTTVVTQFMFNIQENENETTGNCIKINMKEKINEAQEQGRNLFIKKKKSNLAMNGRH